MTSERVGALRRAGKTTLTILRQAAASFLEDEAETRGAALAFYSLFSVAPLLVVATAVAAAVFGDQVVGEELGRQLGQVLTPDAARWVEDLIADSDRPGTGLRATIVGLVTLAVGSTGAFAQMQGSLNAVWNVPTSDAGPLEMLKTQLVKRGLSFALVVLVGVVLCSTIVAKTVFSVFKDTLAPLVTVPSTVVMVANTGVDLLLLSVFLALVYKWLPDADVRWRDVAVGAVVTALLLALGQLAFSTYVTRTAVTSIYGPAGSLVAIVLLAYLSALAFLFGAELTQAYAKVVGRTIRSTR